MQTNDDDEDGVDGEQIWHPVMKSQNGWNLQVWIKQDF